jgi:hypothetical protein
MGREMGIVKATKIVANLDIETLKAIEEVINHYSNRHGNVIAGVRLVKEHGDDA